MQESLIYNFFDDDQLLRISNKIKDVEKSTAGEVCVSIKEKRSSRQRKLNIKTLAEQEFKRLGVDQTRDATGVLIFILLEDRQFYILADSGINSVVPEKTWDNLKDEIQSWFERGEFCKGLIHGIIRIGEILKEKFPVKPDDANELTDRVKLS